MTTLQIPARGLLPGMIFRLSPDATARYLVLNVERRERTDNTVHLTVQFLLNNAISTEVLSAEEDLIYAGTIFSSKLPSQIRAEYPQLIGKEVLSAPSERVQVPMSVVREITNEVLRNTQGDLGQKALRSGVCRLYDLLARRAGTYRGFVLRAPNVNFEEEVSSPDEIDTTWRKYV